MSARFPGTGSDAARGCTAGCGRGTESASGRPLILGSQNKVSRWFEVGYSGIRAVRERASLSESELTRLIGVSVKTLENWEQDRRRQTGLAAALLPVIGRAPRLAVEALHRPCRGSGLLRRHRRVRLRIESGSQDCLPGPPRQPDHSATIRQTATTKGQSGIFGKFSNCRRMNGWDAGIRTPNRYRVHYDPLILCQIKNLFRQFTTRPAKSAMQPQQSKPRTNSPQNDETG